MGLAKKLNLKDGMKVRVLGKPAGVDLDDVATTTSAKADCILLFARTLAEVEAKGGPLVEAVQADALAWVAYPKAGKLDTDLHRDILARHLEKKGVHGVRIVALDSVWSARRFRPK